MALSITDLKKGMVFQLDGEPFRVIEYGQKVVGRGSSMVSVRVKSLIDGKVLEKTYKGSEKIESADVSQKSVQYLYNDSKTFFFMDQSSYEQFEVSSALVENKAGFMKEGDTVTVQLFDGRVIGVELPKNVYLKVTYSEDAVRGDTSSSIQKDATVETGITVKVPAFIKLGDVISVDTTSGVYRERKKD